MRKLVFRNVYRLRLVEPTPQQRILAAALSVERSTIGATSAALIHGFPLPTRFGSVTADVVLSVGHRQHVRQTGIRPLRQTVTLPSTRWLGVRLATPASTLLLLPRFVDAALVERCLDHALAHRLTNIRALTKLVGELPTAGFRGRRLLVGLLDARSGGIGHRSGLQQRVASWLRAAGLTGWKRNCRVAVGDDEEIEVDFAWVDAKVVLEVSPFFTHGSREKQERDAQRRRLLVAAGWRVVEATDDDLVNAAAFAATVAAIRALLR